MSSKPIDPKTRKKDRLAELESKLADAQKQAETYLSQLKYSRADLDNINKQNQKRIEEAIERGHVRVLTQLLPIADELCIVAEKTRDEGVSMIAGKILKILESEGISTISSVGEKFDPYKHEAVVEVETTECAPGTIVEEIRRGYNYKDKVLRASMVKVAKAPSKREKD